MEDIQKKIEEVINKVQNSQDLLKQFDKEPVKVIEKIVGKDLPDEVVEQIIVAVKSKISLDKASDALDALKKLF